MDTKPKRCGRTPSWDGALLAAAVVLLAGCANQTPVVPMLRVDPSAAARFLYFEKRAAAYFAKQGDGAPKAASVDCVTADEAEDAEEEPVLQTWGASAARPSGAAPSASRAELGPASEENDALGQRPPCDSQPKD